MVADADASALVAGKVTEKVSTQTKRDEPHTALIVDTIAIQNKSAVDLWWLSHSPFGFRRTANSGSGPFIGH